MTDEEKAPYLAKYATDRERFLKEKEVEDKKTGKLKDPTKPKRPQSNYFLFLGDFRKEMAGKTLEGGEKIPSLAGEKWRDMGTEERKKYDLLVEQDKQRYVCYMIFLFVFSMLVESFKWVWVCLSVG